MRSTSVCIFESRTYTLSAVTPRRRVGAVFVCIACNGSLSSVGRHAALCCTPKGGTPNRKRGWKLPASTGRCRPFGLLTRHGTGPSVRGPDALTTGLRVLAVLYALQCSTDLLLLTWHTRRLGLSVGLSVGLSDAAGSGFERAHVQAAAVGRWMHGAAHADDVGAAWIEDLRRGAVRCVWGSCARQMCARAVRARVHMPQI
jgi:hypothetical protein